MSLVAITRLDAALRAAGIPIDGVAQIGATSARIDYQASASAAQQTQGTALVAAFDWSAAGDATWQAQQEKAAAAGNIDKGALQGGVSSDRLVRALALVVLDEVNTLRALVSPVQTPRTAAQLVTAIKAKIAATPE